jgi:hypothetical protein
MTRCDAKTFVGSPCRPISIADGFTGKAAPSRRNIRTIPKLGGLLDTLMLCEEPSLPAITVVGDRTGCR